MAATTCLVATLPAMLAALGSVVESDVSIDDWMAAESDGAALVLDTGDHFAAFRAAVERGDAMSARQLAPAVSTSAYALALHTRHTAIDTSVVHRTRYTAALVLYEHFAAFYNSK